MTKTLTMSCCSPCGKAYHCFAVPLAGKSIFASLPKPKTRIPLCVSPNINHWVAKQSQPSHNGRWVEEVPLSWRSLWNFDL